MQVVLDRALRAAVLLLTVGGCASSQPRDPLQRDRQAAERHNAAGLELVEKQDFKNAQVEFERALESDPFFGQAYCNHGLVLIELDQPFEAAWSLRHAATLMPKASEPRANLALLYERVGKWESAERELREALALAPDDIEVIGQLARVQVRQKKFNDETFGWLQTVASQDNNPAWRDWARLQLIQHNLNSESDSSTGGS